MGQTGSSEPNDSEQIRSLLQHGPEFFNKIACCIARGYSNILSEQGAPLTIETLTQFRFAETTPVVFQNIKQVENKKYTYEIIGLKTPLKLHDMVRFEEKEKGTLQCECIVVREPNIV